MRKLDEVTLVELEKALAGLFKKQKVVFLQDKYKYYGEWDSTTPEPCYKKKDLKQEIAKRKKLELIDVSSVPMQNLEQFLKPLDLRFRFYQGYDHIEIELHPKGHSLADIQRTLKKLEAEIAARLPLVGVPLDMLENLEPYLKAPRTAISFTDLYWYYSGTGSNPESRIYDLKDVQEELKARKK